MAKKAKKSVYKEILKWAREKYPKWKQLFVKDNNLYERYKNRYNEFVYKNITSEIPVDILIKWIGKEKAIELKRKKEEREQKEREEMKQKEKDYEEGYIEERIEEEEIEYRCMHCGEILDKEMSVCPGCGEDVPEGYFESLSPPLNPPPDPDKEEYDSDEEYEAYIHISKLVTDDDEEPW